MIWFKKNKKEENLKDKISGKDVYNVVILEPIANDVLKEIGIIQAEKIRDPDDGLIYLVSKDGEFKEFFPAEVSNLTKGYTIEKAQKELEFFKKKPLMKGENKISRQKKIDELEKIIKALKTKGGAFFYFDKDGNPIIEYVRLNSVFIPLKRNLKLNEVSLPQEYQTKDIISAIEEKKEKYKADLNIWSQLIQNAGWFILVIFLLGNIFWSYKLLTFADSDSNMAKLQQRIDQAPLICAEYLGKTSKNFLEASELAKNNSLTIHNTFNQLKENSKPPIEEVKPKSIN
jgi:hypothetical protein